MYLLLNRSPNRADPTSGVAEVPLPLTRPSTIEDSSSLKNENFVIDKSRTFYNKLLANLSSK